MRSKGLFWSLVASLGAALILGMAGAALAEGESTTDAWQVRAISTPVKNAAPSFISADDGRLAWTGTSTQVSSMYVFNLALAKNTAIAMTPPGAYYNPCADGPWVVFQGGRAGAYDDIYMYDLQNGLVTQLTFNASVGDWNDWNPRLNNSRVVWEKDMLGTGAKPGIYLYDVNMGTSSLVIAGDDYRSPDIWGDYVVCVKNVKVGGKATGASQVILYNLATHETKSIGDETKSNEGPRIDGGKVVWSSGDPWTPGAPQPWITYQIKVYDIATGTTTALTNNVAGNYAPDIEGNLVAWETKLPSQIMAYDLATSAATQVSQQGDEVHSASVDGINVAWYGSKGLYTAVRAADATRFPDVPKNHVYYTAIEGMAGKSIINGYTSGYFGPNDLVTRQQFAKMIVLTKGLTATLDDEYPFTDAALIVHKTGELYAYHYVARAALTGLVEGYPDGSFRPLNNITRQQVITMVVRAGSQVLQPPPTAYKGVLSYADPTHGQNIRLAEYNHLLDGIVGPGGTLTGWSTAGNATRGEVAQMLWNLLGKLSPPS